MKQGPRSERLNFLSDADLERIHQGALWLLENVGVMSESDAVLDVFDRHGAKVDREGRKVYLSPDLVASALDSAPKSFLIRGRDPEMDLLVESGRVYYGMGGTSEPFLWDYASGQPRSPTKADMVAATRVGQALTNVDFVMTLCSAGDAPSGQNYFHEYDAIFRNTTKPIVISALGRRDTAQLIEMAAAACGGESAFRQRPWGVVMATPVSPLLFTRINEGLFEGLEYGMPILYAPGPMMGGTSPATVAGTLTQTIAETLFGLALVQLVKPGAPVILKPDTNSMDMVTGQCTYGSAEQSLGRAAMAQVGRHYRLPTFTTGGGVESKLPDAEAAAQAMMGMLLDGLAGVTLTQNMGTMASGMYGSLEMLAICDEMAHMIKRVLAGVEVNDGTQALEVIQKVGHGKHFLDQDHTLRYFKQELFFPVLFRRQLMDEWITRGAKAIVDVAHDRVQEILADTSPVPLPSGADEALERTLERAVTGRR